MKPDDQRDTDQRLGYQSRGYCISGNTVKGRWFNTITDSIERQGSLTGTMHPNIYGQLYYTSKAYSQLTHLHAMGGNHVSKSFCNSLEWLLSQKKALIREYDENLKTTKEKIFSLNKRKIALIPSYNKEYTKYRLSRKNQQDPGLTRQPGTDLNSKYWGTPSWGSNPDVHYPAIREYRQLEIERKAIVDSYEGLYDAREQVNQSIERSFSLCQSPEVNQR